jgi:hypothetical protein
MGIFIISLLTILVVIEDRQLSISQEGREVALLKDLRTCELMTNQQLQQAMAESVKNKAEVTEEMKKNFYNSNYSLCIQLSGRDSRAFQAVEEDKVEEVVVKEVETEEEK